MKKQLHIFYSGSVQGVGMRYTIRDVASTLKVCGWVKNLRDGRVEVLAEAEEDILNDFFKQVKDRFPRYIKGIALEWLPASGEFRDFQVVF
ncbi:acylphosphatase [bacterium]|nr:MAG: acylphosphatase [bacterium]